MNFLQSRVKYLDAVVFTGGEPLVAKNLSQYILDVKQLGYKVGMHTSGIYPKTFNKVIGLLDWVGLDIKVPFDKYHLITTIKNSGYKVRESLQLLVNSKKDFQCRTTLDNKLLIEDDVKTIKQEIYQLGVPLDKYVVQMLNNSCYYITS